MPNPFVGVRIPHELNEALVARTRETGQSKSDVVITALKNYLGVASYEERLAAIEERLAVLEATLGIGAEMSHLSPVKPSSHRD
ncbi:MAG: hypothetical protein HC890_17090 [Chloroflexaceae bacterium]|nr:hypothetical protein [Chloroflexaceae bacterium]